MHRQGSDVSCFCILYLQYSIWKAGLSRMNIPMYWPQVHPVFRGTLFCSLSPWWHFSSLQTLSWTLTTIFFMFKRSILVNSTRKSFSTPGNTWDFVRFVMIIECRQSLQYICTDILAFTWQLDSMPHHVHISTKVIHLAYGFDSCWPHSDCFWTNVLAVHLP